MGPAVPVPWVPEPKYELHTFPEPGLGPGLELLTAIMRHYQRVTGRLLFAARIMAWNLRQALGDALWYSEANFAERPLHTHTVDRRPGRMPPRTRHQPRGATRRHLNDLLQTRPDATGHNWWRRQG